MSETFGKRLRRIRKEKGISQMELSFISGLPQCQLSGYEKDCHCPSIIVLEWLCEALKVSASELLGF